MKQFMAIIALITIVFMASCAPSSSGGAGGGDDGAVNGYIPLVGGKYPSGYVAKNPSQRILASFNTTGNTLISILDCRSLLITDFVPSSEILHDGDTLTYSFLNTPITLYVSITENTDSETGETYQVVNFKNDQIDPDGDGNLSSIDVSFNLLTKEINSSQKVYFWDTTLFEQTSTLNGTWAENGYYLTGNFTQDQDYEDADTTKREGTIEYLKYGNYTGIKCHDNTVSAIYSIDKNGNSEEPNTPTFDTNLSAFNGFNPL